jgi:hypothetical protein
MKIKNALVLIFCLGLFSQTAIGQGADPVLYKTIVHMDSVLFDAFNTHDLAVLQSVFAENLEFFHDKGGLTNYTVSMENFANVFKQNPDLRRSLVKGSLEIYPLPGYGAVEMGEHRFTHMENGKEIAAVFKFVHVWQWKDSAWKITRVVSVGH